MNYSRMSGDILRFQSFLNQLWNNTWRVKLESILEQNISIFFCIILEFKSIPIKLILREQLAFFSRIYTNIQCYINMAYIKPSAI